MTRTERYQQSWEQGRIPVNCPNNATPTGHTILLAEVGVSGKGEPGVYVFCRSCRCAHLVSLRNVFIALQYGGYITEEDCAGWQEQLPVLEPKRRSIPMR